MDPQLKSITVSFEMRHDAKRTAKRLTRQGLPEHGLFDIYPSTSIEIEIHHELQLGGEVGFIDRKLVLHHAAPFQQVNGPVDMRRGNERDPKKIRVADVIPVERYTLAEEDRRYVQGRGVDSPSSRL